MSDFENNAEEATQELEAARKADPQNPLIWAALAQAYLNREIASKAVLNAETIAPAIPPFNTRNPASSFSASLRSP